MADILNSILFIDESNRSEIISDIAAGRVQVLSMRSPAKEGESNEDSAAVFQVDGSTAVLAVADGFGGCRGGEQASRIAIEELAKALKACSKNGDSLRLAILDGFEAANQAVLDLGIGAASTLAVVEMRERSVRSYHVGDSLALLLGNKGKIKMQTMAHSPVGYAVESGVLGEEEAMTHDERHVVSNMIGAPDMHIQIGSSLPLAKRDTLLMGSDGLFDNMRIEEIVENTRKGALQDAGSAITRITIERMLSDSDEELSKPDDLTFLIFRLN